MFKRITNKKAFTMIELIVVVAVIGVVIGITFPLAMNAGKPQEAASRAKSFYFALQNILINIKSDCPETVTEGYYTFEKDGAEVSAAAGEYIYIIASANKTNGFTEVKVAKSDASKSSEEGYVCLADAVDDTDLVDELNRYIGDEEYGYYYALVDSQCRVCASYWSQEEISVLSDNGVGAFKKTKISYTQNDYIDRSIVGSFPTEYSSFKSVMFMDY